VEVFVGVVPKSVIECVFGILLAGLQVVWLFRRVWPAVFDSFLLAVDIRQDRLVEVRV